MNDDRSMKVFFLFTGSGALVILTSYGAIDDPALLRRLAAKGIDKFLSYQIPLALARERYGKHFDVVLEDLSETDDLRVLDFDGTRAFRLFSFREMGAPLPVEP
ncbi:hypothetical protein GCM10011611_24770 [Aliidongia dinghuensis]|uniref:Cytosolic protein n=1 Tax=Aliidongia dinghuensis TaxID=1867774 RepID=A0A8J3E3C7_9PROT|nr:hypothetical protein [Aliidongia dinghuensis]GGF17970.1 hypothetical protein GCM10011611_24770 [Aliidongia dinghuensis]